MARPSNREAILDAYEAVLIEGGATEATLDAIAEAAGVSKGGLLYHFGSKSALLTGFGERLLSRIDRIVAGAPSDPAKVVRWYLDAEPTDIDEAILWRSILAALHGADSSSDAEAIVREGFTRYAKPLEVLEETLAEHVRLVGDGLFLNSMLGIAPRDGFEAIVTELSQRAASQRPA